MAIGITALTNSYDNVDRTAYTTASISPAGDSLLIVFTTTSHGTLNAPDIAVTGLSLSWTPETTVTYSGGVRRNAMSWAICGASPGSGTLTLTMVDDGGGTTATGCGWAVLEVTGYDTGTPIVQSPSGQNSSGTTASVTLAAAGSADNRVVSFTSHRANEATTFQTDWSELTDNNAGSPSMGMESQWRSDAFESPATATFATSNDWCITAVEIAVAVAAGGQPTTIRYQNIPHSTAGQSASGVKY